VVEYLTRGPIDIETWHRQATDARDGASVEFLGIVRGEEEGHRVQYLDYEAYSPMAERKIGALVEETKKKWSLHRVYVRHRIGRVGVGEVSVVIGIQAPHRKEAFDACQFLIGAIKRDVPIWKKPYVDRTHVSEKGSLVQRA